GERMSLIVTSVIGSDSLADIAAYGMAKGIKGDYPPGNPVTELRQIQQKVGEIVATFREEARHIRAANEYSEIGKKRNLATLAANHLPRLDLFRPFIDGHRKALLEARQKMTLKETG